MENKTIPPVISKQDAVGRIRALWEEKRKPILVGVSGLGASGKSTLTHYLHTELDGSALVEVDDFYKTENERAGDNVSIDIISNKFDWDLLDERVFRPLQQGRDLHYHRCRREGRTYTDWVFQPVERIVIVEGIYLFQDRFIDQFDFTIWVEAPHDVRLRRGVARDELIRDGTGDHVRIAWETIWLPQDKRYVDHERPDLRASVIINGI